MDLPPLLAPDLNWLHLTTARPAEVADAVATVNRHKGVVARVLRGHKMRSPAALFDEVAAALQFPPYFGVNWDALDECLADLNWLPPGNLLIAITAAHEVLDRAPPADRQLFWGLLEGVAGERACAPAAVASTPPRVLRVLAQCPAEEVGRLPVAGQPPPAIALLG
jgi:hypothetical protein